MENIQDFLEKQKNWVTFEDKKNDFSPFLRKIFAKVKCERPDPLVKQEKDLLKAIFYEIKGDQAVVRARMDVRKKAYVSPLEEIYKMPGCIHELKEQLKSHPTIGEYETEMITQEWYEQYNHHARELRKNSSTPEKEIEEREEFLTRKCVEIAKAKAEMEQLVPEIRKVNGLLRWTNCLLYSGSKIPDKKAPSRKKFSFGEASSSSSDSSSSDSSSSGEDSSSSSSRESKRARK